MDHQQDFIKQTKLFHEQILQKANDAKTALHESRNLQADAKQITHERNVEFAYSDDLFKKATMPTASQISHMEKNTDALSDFDRESIEKIQDSKNQLRLRIADNIKKD